MYVTGLLGELRQPVQGEGFTDLNDVQALSAGYCNWRLKGLNDFTMCVCM